MLRKPTPNRGLTDSHGSNQIDISLGLLIKILHEATLTNLANENQYPHAGTRLKAEISKCLKRNQRLTSGSSSRIGVIKTNDSVYVVMGLVHLNKRTR